MTLEAAGFSVFSEVCLPVSSITEGGHNSKQALPFMSLRMVRLNRRTAQFFQTNTWCVWISRGSKCPAQYRFHLNGLLIFTDVFHDHRQTQTIRTTFIINSTTSTVKRTNLLDSFCLNSQSSDWIGFILIIDRSSTQVITLGADYSSFPKLGYLSMTCLWLA